MRTNDMHMKALVNLEKREIFLTGAIDEDETRICMEIDLPEAGNWRIIKSETNLTDYAWTGWLINLNGQIHVPEDGQLSGHQFSENLYYPDLNALMFYGGEVRPGEPVLKVMDFFTKEKKITMSHSRCGSDGPPAFAKTMTANELRKTFENELIKAHAKPSRTISASVRLENESKSFAIAAE